MIENKLEISRPEILSLMKLVSRSGSIKVCLPLISVGGLWSKASSHLDIAFSKMHMVGKSLF